MVNKTIVNKKQASIIPLLWRGRGRGEKQQPNKLPKNLLGLKK
jgi:hypothetical protein